MKVDTRPPLLYPRPDAVRAAAVLATFAFIAGVIVGLAL